MQWLWRHAFSVTLIGALITVVLVIAWYAGQEGAGPMRSPREVTLYADDALRPVMEEIIDKFQRRSDVRIHAHYAASQELLADFMADPAAVELLLLGDVQSLSVAVEAGHIADFSPSLALAHPVLLTQSGNPQDLESVADLQRPGLRVGLAHPTSPLGRTTLEILENYGVRRDALNDNLALEQATAPELVNAVRIGRLDATVVWESTARRVDRVALLLIPPARNSFATLQIGLSAAGARSNAALEFVRFTGQRAARDSLVEHHYLVDGASIESAWYE